MSDTFGKSTIPLVAPAAGEAVSDPLLTVTLAFLKAFLQTDSNALAAWQASGIAPTLPIVNTTFPHNPGKPSHDFNTKHLAALYLWRVDGRSERIAEDWWTEHGKLTLLWIPPLVKRATATSRNPIFNGIAKAVQLGIERGRTPGYIFAGDTDPAAATQGSVFYTAAGTIRIACTSWRPADFVEINEGESKRTIYEALEMTLETEEKIEEDLARYDLLAGVDQTIKNEAGGTTDHEVYT